MCEFCSFILTKSDEYWHPTQDRHEAIIAHHGLERLDRPPLGLVRVEITPSETPCDLSTWSFRLDQDIFPEWTFRGDPDLETRTRRALERRAAAEHWFEELTDDREASVGYAGTATAGDAGTATAGDAGTATAGDAGTATAGDDGTATAGVRGTATAGVRGTATAGYAGTATAGYDGTATAGDDAIVAIKWWDGNRYRMAVGYTGEDGIEAGNAYCVQDGKLVEVSR